MGLLVYADWNIVKTGDSDHAVLSDGSSNIQAIIFTLLYY